MAGWYRDRRRGSVDHAQEDDAHQGGGDRGVLARRPAEVTLVADAQGVERESHRAVERAEARDVEAGRARLAIEDEEERADRDRPEQLEQAEIEARPVGKTHREKAVRGDADVIVRERAAGAAEDPGEGKGEGDDVEEGEHARGRKLLAAHRP